MSTTPAPIAGVPQRKIDFLLFEQHQSKFRELYLGEKKSLAQVKREMETNYGFPETNAKIYEYGLRHLGFIKKLPIEGWIEVDVCAKKRKDREGKETDVYLSGVRHSWDRIKRRISRHKNGEQVRKRICRRSTPDWPEGIVLKTPPLSPNTMVNISQRDFTRIPSPTLEMSSINIKPSSGIELRQPLNVIWTQMLSNPNSTSLWLPDVPSSQLMNVFKQTFDSGSPAFRDTRSYEIDMLGFQWDCAHITTPINQLHRERVSPHLNPTIQTQLHFMESFSKFCMILANGDYLEISDPEGLLAWVGIHANKQALKSFFAPDLPAVAAMWIQLIQLSRDFRSGDAFRTLVEVGFETHNGEWIQQHAQVLIWATADLGSKRVRKIARRLLSSKLVRHELDNDPNYLLWNIAKQLDFELMSIFADVGVKFTLVNPNITPSAFRDAFYKVSRSPRISRQQQQQQWVKLLKMGGFDFDWRIECLWFAENVFGGFDELYDKSYRRNCYDWSSSCLDAFWLSGQYEIYEEMVGSSKHAKTQITVPGLIMAALRGTEQLQFYLASRQAMEHKGQEMLLETALSVAAGLGNVVAIKSFGEAKVDPNTHMLLSCPDSSTLDWHPLMRAAGGKHLDAVRVLVEMGAEMTLDVDFNPLSAAVWTPKPLSDTKRLEQLETVRYFIRNGLAHTCGVDAMIKAVTPPYERWYQNKATLHDFGPDEEMIYMDEEIVGMLLVAGVRLNGIMVQGKNLLHYAIDRGCNLKTVEFLCSHGAQIHSCPCLKDGKTMLHSAAASKSADSQHIIEVLLMNGVSCTHEYGGFTVLESVLPLYKAELDEPERARKLQLVSFLLDRGAQVNGPEERLPPVKLEWTPILTRLLEHDAPDTLIHRTIQAGADINPAISETGIYCTPLQLAARRSRLDVTRWLLAQGADINAPAASSGGRTALQAACRPGLSCNIDVGLIQLLIDNGADVNAPAAFECGATALQCAIKEGSMGVFCFLLDAGADVHATAKDRIFRDQYKSALDTAAEFGRLDMVDILLRNGAESYTHGRTPYDGAIELATEEKHFPIAKMLKGFAKWNNKTCQKSV
ncbi:hypothetical protein CHU98_g11424 [Xylaria longipes]|nr:hypothetical protein CHU98_g11424 [Xylaria longipes]